MTPLSGQRAAVLRQLLEHPEGARITTLAAELDLHPSTIREHAEALTEAGLAERTRAEPSGRGRPAWLYSAADSGVDSPLADPRLRDYAGLAMSLASALTRISTDLEEDAVAAGIDWGRELAEADTTVGPPEERVVAVLTQLGFAPQPGPGSSIALTQCPLLDAARRYPDVVCRVHLGIVRGALEVFDGTRTASNLRPFAAEGSCTLELRRLADE